MGHPVLGALVTAGFADLRAELAKLPDEVAPARHVAGGEAADRSAVHIERDAARHHLYVLLLKAGGRTVVARNRTCVAGLDALLVSLVSHGNLLIEERPHGRVVRA